MQLRQLTILSLACALFGLPGFVNAYPFVKTNSAIYAENLKVTPSGGGMVEFYTDPDFLDVRAWSMAKNSLGEYDDQSADNWQNGATDLSVHAAVTWAKGNGDALYSTGTVAASSAVDIPPYQKGWAYGEGMGSIGQWFQVTGGTGTTDTDLTLDYSGDLYGSAGDNSYFWTQIIVGMELWEYDSINDLLTQMLIEKKSYTISGGPNETKSLTAPLTKLGGNYAIAYDNWYWVYFEADSETYGKVPEPGALYLMLFGLAIFFARRLRSFC